MTSEEQLAAAVEMVQARHRKPNGGGKYPYRLVPFAELRPGSKSSFLVDGVIPRAGLVAVWGPPKCGKSFWTFDLVMQVNLVIPPAAPTGGAVPVVITVGTSTTQTGSSAATVAVQ